METTPKGIYRILPMEQIIYGPGAVNQVAGEVDRLRGKRVFLVSGNSLIKSELGQKMREILGSRLAGTFMAVQHVPRQSVMAGARAAREAGADLLISFGGGSPNDTAKAIALCLAEGLTRAEQLERYRVKFQYPDKLEVPGLINQTIPHISVSTTLSVAEFTNVVGITDEARKAKDLYVDNKLVVKTAVLDPEVTVLTPDWLWGATGMRAMDHAVEAIYSKSHMPVTDAMSVMAISMLFQYLPAAVKEPANIAAKGQCQIAGWLSIFGLTNVMIGVSHGIGHQLGARFNIPHGFTSCLMLPPSMEFNRPVTAARQAMIARAMGIDTAGKSDEAAAEMAVEKLGQLIRELGLYRRLRDWGVTEADFSSIADDALQDMSVANNPRPVKREDVIQLLRQAW